MSTANTHAAVPIHSRRRAPFERLMAAPAAKPANAMRIRSRRTHERRPASTPRTPSARSGPTTAAGKMTFTVLAAVAEFEGNLISGRALEAARARGRKSGRLSKRTLARLRTARQQLYDSKEHTVQE